MSEAKPNRYSAKCHRCGILVEAEEGELVFQQDDNGPGWVVAHLVGKCPAPHDELPRWWVECTLERNGRTYSGARLVDSRTRPAGDGVFPVNDAARRMCE